MKRFACLYNEFFRYFIPFLLCCSLIANKYFDGKLPFFFSKTPHISLSRGLRSGLKSCLIAVLTVYSWAFNSLAWFLIDVVGSFLIPIARAKTFSFFVQSSIPSFSVNFFLSFVYDKQKKNKQLWHVFDVKHIIDSLLFLFLLTHIGLNLNSNKKCLDKRANQENLDSLRVFFFQKWDWSDEKNVLKIIPYFASASCNSWNHLTVYKQ